MDWFALLTHFLHHHHLAGLAGCPRATRQSSAMLPRGPFPPAKHLPPLQHSGTGMLEQRDAGSCAQSWALQLPLLLGSVQIWPLQHALPREGTGTSLLLGSRSKKCAACLVH